MNRAIFLAIGTLALTASGALGQPSTPSVPELAGPVVTDTRLLTLNDSSDTIVISFENIQGTQSSGGGFTLSNQYEKSLGLRFGRGASVQLCAQIFDAVQTSLCPYPQAASGQRAALHNNRTGGPAMIMDFRQPVSSVSMRINPTGGAPDEVFIAQIEGFNAAGDVVATNSVRFNWFQDAFTWPTTAALTTKGARLTRISVELRRVSQNNQPVRFLIDDLTFAYAPAASPVIAALAAQKGPPRAPDAVIVQSDEIGEAQSNLRLYPAATRKRMAIDWEAADDALAKQKDMGLEAAPYQGQGFVNTAELPLLLPSRADAGSVIVVGNRDSYNAHFTVGGVAYSLYGSRLLTVINKHNAAPAIDEVITYTPSAESLTASFSVYGAAYSLTRHCAGEDVDGDPACHSREAMGDIAAEMAVVIGAAGKERR